MLGTAGALGILGRLAPGRWGHEPLPRPIADHRLAPDPRFPPLGVARGPDPARIVRAAVAAVGGMDRFVGRGDTVLLKPNMAWDRSPEQGANTHPAVVGEVARLCRGAGAQRVIVAENPVHDAKRAADRSGIAWAVAEAGGDLVLPTQSGFTVGAISGSALDTWDVLSVLFEADKLINLPVVKSHSLSGLTCGLKNHMGLLGGTRGRLHQEIHAAVADLAAAFRPTLTVVDATRMMVRGGPTGGRLDDVVATHAVAAGTDPVACDAWAAALLGLDPASIPHIVLAESRGLGRAAAGARPVEEHVGD